MLSLLVQCYYYWEDGRNWTKIKNVVLQSPKAPKRNCSVVDNDEALWRWDGVWGKEDDGTRRWMVVAVVVNVMTLQSEW